MRIINLRQYYSNSARSKSGIEAECWLPLLSSPLRLATKVNMDRFNAAVCVGSCAVYRRVAVEPFGGVAPIEHSEDMYTGYKMTELGYKVRWEGAESAAPCTQKNNLWMNASTVRNTQPAVALPLAAARSPCPKRFERIGQTLWTCIFFIFIRKSTCGRAGRVMPSPHG